MYATGPMPRDDAHDVCAIPVFAHRVRKLASAPQILHLNYFYTKSLIKSTNVPDHQSDNN